MNSFPPHEANSYGSQITTLARACKRLYSSYHLKSWFSLMGGKAAFIILLTTFFGFLSCIPARAQQPGDKQTICRQQVPGGWITTHVGARCDGAPIFGLENYTRDIVYYDGLPTGSKLTMSADVKPQGWIKTSVSIGPAIPAIIDGKLGSTIYYNNDILKIEGMPTGSQAEMVDDIAPQGWVCTGARVNQTAKNPLWYYAKITRYEGMPPGTRLDIVSQFVPTGWIATAAGTTKVGTLTLETRKILRIDSLTGIDEITIVGSFPPEGWVTIDMGSIKSGGKTYQTRKIRRITKLDAKVSYNLFEGQVPDGWIQSDFGAKNTGMGSYIYKVIKNYKEAAPGTEMSIIDVYQPDGWVTIAVGGKLWLSTIYQTRKIKKIDGLDQLNEITIVDQYAPPGWLPVTIGRIRSGVTIYETRKIIRISSMDPAKEYMMSSSVPPNGWLATGLSSTKVQNTVYELFKIKNYYNMPVGKKITVIDNLFSGALPPAGWTTVSTGQIKGLVNNFKTYTIIKKQNIITGDVSGTWTKAGSPYVIRGQVFIPEKMKLTVMPGVEIQTYSDNDHIVVNGTLAAGGTANEPILIRGLRDPADQTTRPGGYLTFSPLSKNSVLDFVTTDRLGDNYTEYNGINVNTSSLIISNSLIKNSLNTGINILADNKPVIRNNIFSGNNNAITAVAADLVNVSANTNANICLTTSVKDNETLILKNQGAGSYYFFRSVYQVNLGSSLTIEPGTEFRWTGNDRNHPDVFSVYGTLIAKGTDKDSIRFSGNERWKTDNTVSPPGYLVFAENSKNSVLDRVVIDKMGAHYPDAAQETGAVVVGTASVSITNCLFSNSAVIGLANVYNSYPATITNNNFLNNTKDIVTTLNGLAKTRNNRNAKIILINGSMTEDAELPVPGTNSYYRLHDILVIPENFSLKIAPGTLIDLGNVFGGLDVQGTLKAKGTLAEPIKFVRLNPDPLNNSNFSVRLNTTSKNSELDYVTIDGGGSYNARSGALEFFNDKFTASHLAVTNSPYVGIMCYNDKPLITNSSIKNNRFGVLSWHCSPTFKNCEISGNTEYGILTATNYDDVVDARNNLWGDPTGPFHKILNQKGKGNQVSDKVLFMPFKAGSKLPQHIVMDTTLSKSYGDADFVFKAASSSGLPLKFKVSDPLIASIDTGRKIHIKAAGKVQIIFTQKGDVSYAPADTAVLDLTINKAQLTIRANNKKKLYGDPNPTFSFSYEGFVNGEGVSKVKPLPVVTTDATQLSKPGSYTLTPGGAFALNYNIMYVPGTLEVSPAPAPSLSAASPLVASEGASVTITGKYLLDATGVNFGGVPASSFKITAPTTIVATLGKAKSGNIEVVTTSGTGSLAGFVFIPFPVIGAVGPIDVHSGESVKLTTQAFPGVSYQWNMDGKSIVGATTNNFAASQSGTYTVTLSVNGVPQTSAGITVKVIFALPPDNFTVSNTSTSCRGSADGAISITAKSARKYAAIVSGPGMNNKAFNFADKTIISGLSPGSYNICLTVEGETSYSQCYTSVITEPADLSVYTAVTPSTKKVLLSLQGSTSYNIILNGQSFATTASQVTLDLRPGLNDLEVSTDKLCQGVFRKSITVAENAIPFPNPFVDIIKLDLGTKQLDKATITVFDTTNKPVYTRTYTAVSGIIETDLAGLRSGVYFLKISSYKNEHVYKIVKQ